MPLVLHGGTGIPDDMIKKAIDLGVSKINVNTDVYKRQEQIDEMSNVTYRDYKDASGNVVKSESVCASKYKPLNSGS